MDANRRKLIGKRIKGLREIAGLSQDSLADMIQMKRANIANYEAGRSVPQPETLLKLADAFDKTTDFLLCRDVPDEEQGGIVDLGHAIKTERTRLGMSQQQLADAVSVHQSVISQYERDLVEVPEAIAEKIAQEFGYSLNAFMAEHDLINIDVHPEFDGDVDRQIQFDRAVYEDAMSEGPVNEDGKDEEISPIDTLAAHHDGEDWTEEELEELERFKEFVRMRRHLDKGE